MCLLLMRASKLEIVVVQGSLDGLTPSGIVLCVIYMYSSLINTGCMYMYMGNVGLTVCMYNVGITV